MPDDEIQDQPSKQDFEILNALAICHYVHAGLLALGGLIPLIYVAIGIFAFNVDNLAMQPNQDVSPPPLMDLPYESLDGESFPSETREHPETIGEFHSQTDYAGSSIHFDDGFADDASHVPFDNSNEIVGVIFIIIGSIGFLLAAALALCIFMAGRGLHKARRHTLCFVMACIQCLMMPLGTILGVFTIVNLTKANMKEYFNRID